MPIAAPATSSDRWRVNLIGPTLVAERERLYRLLMGDHAGAEARVLAAMLSAAIAGVIIHPLVLNLDDDTLLARRFLDLPE